MKNSTLLMRLACAAAFALLIAGNAQADIVNFTAADPGAVSLDNGTATFTTPADDSIVTSLMYSVSGLDLDGEGLLNDGFTVTVPFSPINGNNIQFDSSSQNELDHNGGTFGNGEGISYGAITISGTSSTGLAYQLDSAVYTQFTFRRFTNGDEGATIVGDVSGTITVPDGQSANNLNDTVFDVTTTAGTNNVDNIDFRVEISTVSAVPEPSSMAILAAGLGLIVVRRRRNK